MDCLPTSTGSSPRPRRPRREWRFVLAAVALAIAVPATAQNPLPPEKAFRFSARLVDAQTVEARFVIANGYYLYRDKVHLKDAKPGQRVVIAAESQGCADIGLCYPPTVQRVTLALPEGSVVPGAQGTNAKKPWFN